MNWAAQECTEVCMGRETPPAAPKALLVFVSQAAPSTINVSLSVISHSLEDSTSLSTSSAATNERKATKEREVTGSNALSAALGSNSSRLDRLTSPVVGTVKGDFCQKKHKQHFIIEITVFPWIARSCCQKRLLWWPPNVVQHRGGAGGWLVPLQPSSSPYRPSRKESEGHKFLTINCFK